jgi:copper chaperone CopZ
LIAGPATNAATFTTIWKLLGRRTAILYITTIAVSAFGCGLLLDWLFPMLKETLPMPEGSTHAHLESGWLSHVWAIALVAVLAMAYLMSRPGSHEKTEKDKCNTDISSHRQRLELLITGMMCNHCAESVRDAIAEVSGVRSAEVNLKSGRAIVMGDNLDQKRLMAAVEGLGYTVKMSTWNKV